jgi:hypothetical protein
LWWTALVVAVVGASLTVLMIHESSSDPVTYAKARIIILVTIMAAGVCVISATSRWWMSR